VIEELTDIGVAGVAAALSRAVVEATVTGEDDASDIGAAGIVVLAS
jgi:hypothetical protein